MEDKKKKIIKQNLTRKRFCGMTPEQIRKAYDNKPEKVVEARKIQQKPLRANEIKSVKAQRLTSPFKKSKTMLLETPAVASQLFIPYRVPTWFETKEKADVSIIIPMFRSSEAIKTLIESWDMINDGTKVEVIYVDDCCPQNSKDVVVSAWTERKGELKGPIGKIIYNPENQGFGVSCNIGARNSTADYLIFLNADTIVTPGWLRPILRLIKKEDVGIVGNMQLKSVNGKDIIDSAGSEWDWNDLSFIHIGRNSYNGKRVNPFSLNNCPKDIFETQEREMVTGACIAIRKSLFNEIGGFNPNYRISYWEDSEICMTVKELGYKIMYQPNSRIYHTGQHSKSGTHRFIEHNKSYFINKWVNSGRIDSLVKSHRTNRLDIKNIVVRRQAAHGDVLMAAAIAPAIKKMYPSCKLSFSTMCSHVLEGNPYIDKIVTDQELSERSFDLYYNLDMAYEYRPNTNILKAYADVVGASVSDCKMFLKTNAFEGLPENYVVIHSGHTNWVGRDWSPTKFDIVSSQLQKAGHKVVCIGSGSDNRISCDLDLRGKTKVPELAYVIQHAKLFVGIDSFPMHVAQTFDVPGVCFFGSVVPDTRLVSKKMLPVTANNVKCLGCHHRQLPPCTVTSVCETQFLDCINQVSVNQMMAKIQEALAI
jgi:GT2 family glycosyltransferase/ADP-heptose:LPS heptosyltransferase